MEIKQFAPVLIGEGAYIGARSLITRSVPAYAGAAGSPAMVIRKKDNSWVKA